MSDVAEIRERLLRDVEAVCRHYLPAGRRMGRYWLIGDVQGSRGRSLYVRLAGPEAGRGSRGRWADAATGERGDVFQLIAANRALRDFASVLGEARCFLALPPGERRGQKPPAPQGSPLAARRLFAGAKPLGGTLGERYLRARGITRLPDPDAVRFHPRCYYRGDPDVPGDTDRDDWPALIAAATDGCGQITGVHRTWLALDGSAKALIATPRRAIGTIAEHGVRLGRSGPILAIGEGLETMLSLREIAPRLPLIAAGSANHLDQLVLPTGVERLYIVDDNDASGARVLAVWLARAAALGLPAHRLAAPVGDLNDWLRTHGRKSLGTVLQPQLVDADARMFASA